MKKRSSGFARSHESGLSLLEMAISLVILGVVGVLLARWYAIFHAEKEQVVAQSMLERAENTLIAFSSIHNRLPCPAVDQEGREDCTTNSGNGKLPWRTLGLADARAARLDYAVLRRPHDTDTRYDADLATLIDRNQPMKVLAGSVAAPHSLANRNGLDFCQSLRVAMRLPFDKKYVHTPSGNVAYAISTPLPSTAIEAGRSTTMKFTSPRAAIEVESPHLVRAGGFDQLWSRLNCSTVMASVNYSHFSAAAAAEIESRSMVDLEEQLRIMVAMSKATVRSSEASIAQGAAGLISASAGVSSGVADLLNGIANPEKGANIGAGVALLALAIGGQLEAAAVVAAASIFHQTATSTDKDINDLYAEMKNSKTGLTAKSRALAKCLYAEAVAADVRGAVPNDAAVPSIPSCTP